MRAVVLLSSSAVLAGLAAAAEPPKPAAAESLVLACAAPFDSAATEASLKARFGAENVTVETRPGPEGYGEVKPTVLFAKDPARRIEVFWTDEAKREGLASVEVTLAFDQETYEPAKVQSGWVGPLGLTLGQTIGDVAKANGKPFELSGFGWDYGGFATDWKDGALAKPEGGCLVQARFDLGYVEGREVPPEIMGDGTLNLSSDLPALEKAGAKLSFFAIAYPSPE